MATESIILPDIPTTATELEDYVAALFQAAGYFVQRGVTERDPTDVLELDAVVTDYGSEPPRTIIAEAKSGDWGYPDIFKLLGWMFYLRVAKSAFFVRRVPEGKDLAKVSARVGPLGIAVAHLTDPNLAGGFERAGFPRAISDDSVEVWRFIYVLERCF